VEAIIIKFSRATTDGVNLYGPITAVDIRQSLLDSHMALKVKSTQIRMPALGSLDTAVAVATLTEEQDGAVAATVADEAAAEQGLDSVGAFTVQVEAQPSLWCNVTVEVHST
jgi:hypothetical protein